MSPRIPALLVLASLAAPAQKLMPPADARDRIDRVFAQFNRPGSPGCAVGVALDGATVASSAYGMADLEHDVPLRPDSIFEPGSVSKQFTAAAILKLALDGKLSLDDPARKYIPELPDYGAPISIRHLLNHTSGLRDWGSIEAIAGWPRTTRAYTQAHVLDILSRQHTLNYPPGAEYSYTNSGYNLLAILVGRVSGEPLAEYTRDTFFTPLGMASTSWRDDFHRIVKGRAIAYSQNGNSVRQLMPFEDVHGNGGLLTTTADLLRWNQKFTIAHQLDRGKLTDGRTIAYAAGLMILHYKGLDEISHSGTTAGYNAWLGRYPAQGLSVAVLCNTTAANGTQLGHAVADIFLGDAARPDPRLPLHAVKPGLYRSLRDYSIVEVGSESRYEFAGDRMRIHNEIDGGTWYERVKPWTPAATDLQPLAGEYTSDEAETTLRIAVEGGRLVMHRRPDNVIPLTPVYEDAFHSSLGMVRFVRDKSGTINELSVSESRVWDLSFRKVR
jgi:CubicO group peptidase (beta-lactamase class C family)